MPRGLLSVLVQISQDQSLLLRSTAGMRVACSLLEREWLSLEREVNLIQILVDPATALPPSCLTGME
jgi:hypothetical protein